MTTTIQSNENIHNKIMEVLDFAAQDVHLSRHCLDNGVLTDTAKYIEKSLSDPSALLLDMHNQADDYFTGLADQIVTRFLCLYQEVLIKAIRVNDSLNYLIALKENTLELRTKFLRFIDIFGDLDFAEKFPINFIFVSEGIANKYPENAIVKLTDGKTYQASEA